MPGAVADGKYVGIGGTAVIIDDDAIVDLEPRAGCEFRVRHDAYADDDHVGSKLLAVGQLDGSDLSVAAESRDSGGQHDVDAVGSVLLLVERRYRRRYDAAHHAVFHFYHRYLRAELRSDCRNLETDVAGTDDCEPRTLGKLLPDHGHIRDGSQIMNAVEIGAGHVEYAWSCARRDDERVERNRFLIGSL